MKAAKGKESYSSLEKTLRITREEARGYLEQVVELRKEVGALQKFRDSAQWANFLVGVLARALNEAQL
ncbi:MAG: hypothetical protein ABSD56_01655 [Bryobacteraceae bacterium]|jgi:hypothetical protein